jgi:HTH-type transcriptional regulator/antitoxin HipB
VTQLQLPIEQAVMDAEFFGGMLKKLRKEADLTQSELSEVSGIDQGAIARLERGDRLPTWETVLALCIALNVSCEVFRPPAGPAADASPRRGRPRKPREE